MKQLKCIYCFVALATILVIFPNNSYAQRPKMLLPDFLTLELAFGDKDLPDEFLIAAGQRVSRYNVTVDNKNNVYVFDEMCVKIYDSGGRAKSIVGGPGQGPGEFQSGRYPLPTVGPNGYLTVSNDAYVLNYNVYDPQYKSLKTVFRRPFRPGSQHLCKVIALNESEFIGETYEVNSKDDYLVTTFSLDYLKNEEKNVIASYDITTHVTYRGARMTISYIGDLFWGVLPGGKVVYTHSRVDEYYDDSGYYYIMHIIDLSSGEKKSFIHTFEPVPLSKEEIKTGGGYASSGVNKDKMLKMRTDFLKKSNIKNREAIAHVFFDGNIAYVCTYTEKEINKRQTNYLFDIINLKEGSYLRSVYLPEFTSILAIKNGYLYISEYSDEGFVCIEKYKIDPSVYGK